MEKGVVYSFIDLIDDIEIKLNLYTSFDIIIGIVSKEGPSWNKYNTRIGTRFINEIQFGKKVF